MTPFIFMKIESIVSLKICVIVTFNENNPSIIEV
jgi:hypothetical protein